MKKLFSFVLAILMIMPILPNSEALADDGALQTVTALTYSNGLADGVSVHGFDADTLSYSVVIPKGQDVNEAAAKTAAITDDGTQISAAASGNVATINAGGKTYSVTFTAAENDYKVLNGHSVWGTAFEYSENNANPNTDNFAVAEGVKVGSYATASTASNRTGDEFVYSKIDESILGSSVIKMWKGGGAVASYVSASNANYAKRFYTDSYDGQNGKPYYIEFELTNPATVMFFGYPTDRANADPWPAGKAQGWTYTTYNANTVPIKSKSGSRAPSYSFSKSFAAGETVKIPNWGEVQDVLTSKDTGLNYWHYGFYIVWDDISNADASSLSYSINGQSYKTISDFDKDKLTYTVKVPSDTTTVNLSGDTVFKRLLEVWNTDGVNSDTATIAYDVQNVDMTDKDSASITATVTARDTRTTKSYTVNFVKNSYDNEEWFIKNSIVIGSAYGEKNLVSVTDSNVVKKALRAVCSEKPDTESNFGIVSEIDKDAICAGSINTGENYVLSFYAKAADVSGMLTAALLDENGNVTAANSSCKYYTSGQWTKIIMPFTATGTEHSVKISLGGMAQQVLLGVFDIEKDTEGFKHNDSGYHMEEGSWKKDNLAWGTGLGKNSMDSIRNGDYLYSISQSDKALYVYSIADDKSNPILVNNLTNIGDLRQMALSEDGKTLAITARGDSSFVYDVTSPAEPKLASRIDSLEFASGIDIEGNYCYIADRIYGVSIYDISDKYNPKPVSALHLGECQDVTVHDGWVYAGVWGACKVRVCDVRDITNPKYIRDIILDGRGDGVTVRGDYLYAATGHMNSNSPMGSPSYGLGNGLEIYDISNPEKPIRKSVSKIDGALYCNSPDIWRVTVTADNKAFLSSSYSGVYVFDVTDKALPKRLANINIVAKKGESSDYADADTRDTFVFPYDTREERHSPIIDCEVADGYVYLSSTNAGLYVYDARELTASSSLLNNSVITPENKSNDFFGENFEAMGFENVKVFRPDGQVWSSTRYGNYTYVAAGIDGIYVIDDNFEVKAHYPSQDITMDISVYGNVLYTAESLGGLCTYVIDSSDPTKITYAGSTKNSYNVAVRQIQLSPNAKYAVAQASGAGAVFDVSDIYNPALYTKLNYTMVYQKQISVGAAANRYVILFANGSKTVVCDFGENGSYDKPVITASWTSGLAQTSGVCADGDYMFATLGGRICRFDPSDETLYTKTLSANPEVTKYTVSKFPGGYPSVLGNRAFISAGKDGKLSILDITDRNSSPVLEKTVTFRGTPGIAKNVGSRVYLPLGYSGLLSFTYDGVDVSNTKTAHLTVSVQGGGSVDVNGENVVGIDSDYEYGSTFELCAVSQPEYKFAYWIDASSNRILSTESKYSFSLGESSRDIKAVYVKDSADVKTVIFKNRNGRILLEQTIEVSDTDKIIVPENPIHIGYNFSEWFKDGTSAGSSFTAGNQLGYNDFGSGMNIFVANYNKSSDKYVITVSGGTITSPTTGNYTYDTKITVKADVPEGKVFSHWTKGENNEIISYDENYSFYVSGTTNLTAYFADYAPEKKPVISMYGAVVLENMNRIAFFSERNLPLEYTLVESGIIMHEGDAASNGDLTLDKSGILRSVSTSSNNAGQFVVRKANLSDNETWSARAYMTYKDGTGSICTIYSNVVSETYTSGQ